MTASMATKAARQLLTFIDLFCGCGGFTLGMHRAGFRCLAAIDSDPEAMKVFHANFPTVTHALEKQLENFPPKELAALLGKQVIDVIVGGPPCQGFSHVRKVDSSNHGSRVKRDKRRYLFREFLRYVAFFRPRVFVLENVLGIQTAAKGKFFTLIQSEARALGYRVHSQVEEAWRLGVPQKRRRQLIVGVRSDIRGFFPTQLVPAQRAWFNPATSDDLPTLWDAIGDLPRLRAGTGEERAEYDVVRRTAFFRSRGARARHYVTKVLEINAASALTSHRARPHSGRDLRDFARLREGEHSAAAIARGKKMEFPYDRDCFEDRYKRQHREKLCSTIVAHLSKDGLMFIHPTQNRSLTPREAARIQSFPDWFQFPVPRTHQFRIIGNAVPPLVAEAVGEEVNEFLESVTKPVFSEAFLQKVPSTPSEALECLLPLLDKSRFVLRRVSIDEFRRSWYAVAFLRPDLHPACALDHGQRKCSHRPHDHLIVNRIDPRLVAPFFERSGWPVILAPIAAEAWRRYNADELANHELYSSEAQIAGMGWRIRSPAVELETVRAFAVA
jgi:DNA (cytosine-5)-methyltransferase 1